MIEIRSETKRLRKKDGQGGRMRLRGSALILTVVLTSLLAIVGVMFLMISRIDRMATSGISQDKQLDLAVDTVVGKISEQLVWDVPGTIGALPEYHDYPGPEDRWLASSEPHQVGPAYFWRHISDIYDRFDPNAVDLPIEIIPDYQDRNIMVEGLAADADGDGIADSRWVIIPGITSSKGEPVYAAVRVTDNGGKINVNTGFEFYFDPFDPCLPDISLIDGTSLWQINLMALANRPGVLPTPADANALLWARANYDVSLFPNDLDLYEDNVIWRYGELTMPYTPFDISDELELRNRFLLNQRETYTRIEQLGYNVVGPDQWAGAFRIGLDVPIDQGGSQHPPGVSFEDWWFDHARLFNSVPVDPVRLNRYDYRHLATTYSMDRIINPIGPSFNAGRMANVNGNNPFELMNAIKKGILDANPMLPGLTVERLACQLAANLKDVRDDDSSVTPVWDSSGSGKWYFGYERPCIYISEVTGIYTTDGTTDYQSFAVELYKPYSEDASFGSPGDWRLKIPGVNDIDIALSGTGTGWYYHVILLEPSGRTDLAGIVDPNAVVQSAGFVSLEGKTIYLERSASLGARLTVDSSSIPSAGAAGGWLSLDGAPRSFRRDISRHKCMRRLWDSTASLSVTLGTANGYVSTDTAIVQAHPYLDPNVYTDKYTGNVGFKNVGEIGMVFDVNAYNVPVGSTEADLRLDLRGDPNFARIFNYLTVLDPANHSHPAETRVKGRININTAPPFVLEQLPWIAPPAVGPAIVDMVVAYRDGLVMPGVGAPDFSLRPYRGFRSIGELMQVWVSGFPGFFGMDYYGTDGIDQDGFPDLTPLKILKTRDDAPDDFEERDLIFHRISNLITVRSDVFTAYILVRIGADGPQRRVVAILDRSDVQPNNANTKVKVRALHKVADPW